MTQIYSFYFFFIVGYFIVLGHLVLCMVSLSKIYYLSILEIFCFILAFEEKNITNKQENDATRRFTTAKKD